MTKHEFADRTKRFAVHVIGLVERLPRGRSCDAIANQLVRSASSVGANYRAACRSRSKAEMLSKLGIVEEECDESIFWPELLVESKLADDSAINALRQEANEILAMTVASIRTLKGGGYVRESIGPANPDSIALVAEPPSPTTSPDPSLRKSQIQNPKS